MNKTEQETVVVDPCVYCGRSTAFGAGFGLFVNRIGGDFMNEEGETIDGWACAECAGFDCDECEKQIYLDCEIRVEFTDEDGKYHYGNYHEECYNSEKHGVSEDYEEDEE